MYTLNLHINYTCPLKCKYCVQRENPDLVQYYMTLDDMITKVQAFLDLHKLPRCAVNISGGEPLLKFDEIKELMQHFPQNVWEISTSGYLLTEEKVKFFAKYNVRYILSIDGTEKVTNYLRPLANGQFGYFKQLKENLPALFYYSPQVRAKLIVPQKFITQIFPTYLELERLGFNEIFITPNVYENTIDNEHPELKTGSWRENDWENFIEQNDLINNEIELGIKLNKKRCIVSNVYHTAAKMIFTDDEPAFSKINLKKMICPVLEFKGGSSPAGGEYGKYDYELSPISVCVTPNKRKINTQEELRQIALNDFQKLKDGICPKDKDCKFLPSCVYSTCMAQTIKGMVDMDNIWIPTDFDCRTQKIYHNAALRFLSILNNNQNDATEHYWNLINKIGKRVSINGPGDLLSM